MENVQNVDVCKVSIFSAIYLMNTDVHAFIQASTRENLYLGFANNTGAFQPAHPRSLISAFVIRCLKRAICKVAAGEISIF